MTQKELLYVEDAIGHESSLVSILEESINFLEDEDLKTFMQKECEKHLLMKEKLIDNLKEESK